jgi:exosortase family protein XrtG
VILPALIFFIWAAFLFLFSKHKMYFFKFIVGTVGTFCFLMFTGQAFLQQLLQYAVTYATGIMGNIFNLYQTYPDYSMITVYFKSEAISFFVDYECSGIIEMLVFICLLIFYPIYTTKEKAKLMIIGVIYIFIANVIRVFVICLILKVFGPKLLFFSHTIFARLLFFYMMIIIYYRVFTRPHILRQKVGNLSYGK